MIFDITSQIFVNLETEGPTAEDSWTPPDPNAEGRAFPRAAAWAGRLRLPLSPPPSFALLLLPFSSSCGCCCCQTSPFQTHRAALPCALLHCQGRREARSPTGRSPKPKSEGVRCTRGGSTGECGGVTQELFQSVQPGRGEGGGGEGLGMQTVSLCQFLGNICWDGQSVCAGYQPREFCW